MKTLYDIFEAIIDKAISEYFSVNTESVEAIQDYAKNGMDLCISDEHALILYYAFSSYRMKVSNDSNDFYQIFEKNLKDIKI